MLVNDLVNCDRPPCTDVARDRYLIPGITLQPENIATILISEAPPADLSDDYYADGDPLFARTTIQAFNDANVDVSSIRDILNLGIYLTTAVKCGKTGYGISTPTINTCSLLLERELALFPHARTYLLMGDVAIRALNQIARRTGAGRVIPAGSTYKIRSGEYYYGRVRVFPSYVQAGPSFFIEKTKRAMIAQDIAAALQAAGINPPRIS